MAIAYRSLGRTGVKVSPLCLGCMRFGEKTSPEETERIIAHAVDAGINFLDTANVYARGRSEEVTGAALKRLGKRDRVVLATKVHGRMSDDDPNLRGNSRRNIIAACEASLKRLQTDWIDLYQLHRPQSDIPMDETLRAMDDLIRAGKVRYIGTSTFAAWQVVESLWMAHDLGLNRVVCEQPPYNILDRRIERELLPMCRTHGIGVIPWSPMAGGLLSGKYRQGQPPPAEGRFANWQRDDSAGLRYNPRMLEVVEGLVPLAEAKGCTLSQFALAWCLHQPGVTSPIIGPRTFAQREDNLKALEVTVTDADRAAIDALVAPGTFVSDYYGADFGPHQFRWP